MAVQKKKSARKSVQKPGGRNGLRTKEPDGPAERRMMRAIKEVFLPPAIQQSLHANPPQGEYLHDYAVSRIEELWAQRNRANDADVAGIDILMERIVRSEADGAAYSYGVR
jgi:hypothetical protein